jgi:hypothetical protein
MHPFLRIVLEFLGPAFFGGLQAIIVSTIGMKGPFGVGVKEIGAFFLIAFAFSLIQSLCYVITLEIAYWVGLSRRSYKAIAFSTLLGVLGGMWLTFEFDSGSNLTDLHFFCPIGAIAGAIIASIIYYFESPQEKQTA